MRSVPIWDLPTRLFHWILAALIGVALLTGEDEGGIVFLLHLYAGYGILGLLAFRVPWGFLGSRHSRFADFVRGWATVKPYSKALFLKLEPPRWVGHNPLGGWMVLLLLLGSFLAAFSGLFAGDEGARGALAAGSGWPGAILGELHDFLGNLLIPLIAVHIAGVLVDWFLTGENLVRAMIDGRKDLDDAVAAEEPPLASPWRALAVVAIVAAAGYYLIGLT
jgi:cytochrome b